MSSYLSVLIDKYKEKGVFIDSGILLPFVVGSTNPRLIKNFKRTANFDKNDFILITEFVEAFDYKITSPHILTEVSDLLGESNDFHIFLETYINLAEEKFLPSIEITKSETFLKFGLADSAIIDISKNSYLIFTSDNRFYGYLEKKRIDAVTFDLLKSVF